VKEASIETFIKTVAFYLRLNLLVFTDSRIGLIISTNQRIYHIVVFFEVIFILFVKFKNELIINNNVYSLEGVILFFITKIKIFPQ